MLLSDSQSKNKLESKLNCCWIITQLINFHVRLVISHLLVVTGTGQQNTAVAVTIRDLSLCGSVTFH